MKQPADYQTYREYQPANCNRDPVAVLKKFDELAAMRDKTARTLANPLLQGDDRRTVEMMHARANRLLRQVDEHRQQFTQARLLERMRQP